MPGSGAVYGYGTEYLGMYLSAGKECTGPGMKWIWVFPETAGETLEWLHDLCKQWQLLSGLCIRIACHSDFFSFFCVCMCVCMCKRPQSHTLFFSSLCPTCIAQYWRRHRKLLAFSFHTIRLDISSSSSGGQGCTIPETMNVATGAYFQESGFNGRGRTLPAGNRYTTQAQTI